MSSKRQFLSAMAALCAVLALSVAQAADVKPTDGGNAEEFKGKKYEVEEKGKTAVTLDFPADKEATITVHGDKKTDVYLFVFDEDGKQVAKDDSPGPDCEVKLTPKKAGKYTLEIRNLGPGATTAALKVDFGKSKDK
jgi:hypothetical protein